MQLPAHIQNRPSRGLAQDAVGGLNAGQPARISLERNTFTLVDAAGNKKGVPAININGAAAVGLDVIVVDANPHLSKIYYGEVYTPGAEEHKPPTCYSDNGKGASSRASEPQHTSCQICPLNAWGSDTSKVTGKQTKACNDVKKIAVIVPSVMGGEPFLLRIPPATLKNWNKYVTAIAGQVIDGRRVDVTDLVTRITFDAQTQGVLNFTPAAWVDETQAKLVDELYEKQTTSVMVGKNDTPWDGTGREVLAAPVRPAGQLPPPPAPQTNGMQLPPQPAAAAPVEAAKTRTRRTKEQIAADKAAEEAQQVRQQPAPQQQSVQQPGPELDIPPFLQRTEQPAPKPPEPAQFGLVPNAPAPTGAISEALAAAFNLPTA